jgi:hypothetical protein
MGHGTGAALTTLNRMDVLTMPSSFSRDNFHRDPGQHPMTATVNQFATARSSGRCELVSDVAHKLHKFMMIDEEVLRGALLRERHITMTVGRLPLPVIGTPHPVHADRSASRNGT